VDPVTNFDVRQCHKWAQLLIERKHKLDQALADIDQQDFEAAKRLSHQIFNGAFGGKQTDPGMTGSLLYHMAMVTKMESETKVLLEELKASLPDIAIDLNSIYSDFESDAKELTQTIGSIPLAFQEIQSERIETEEKIALFTSLKQETKIAEGLLSNKDPKAKAALQKAFLNWTQHVVQMRLIQEYETIKGLLVTSELAKNIGVTVLESAMMRVKEKFGQETVKIALDVTLRVGMRREKLQSVMLSDHFINYTMSTETLDGHMEFLNCPIYGSHKYAQEKYGTNKEVSELFCRQFCFAHAKAMLDTVLPFPFTLWQPKLISSQGNCEFYLKLAYSPTANLTQQFVPLVMSWNVTRECNMKCSHCYINATDKKLEN
jgi:hypothetical protein